MMVQTKICKQCKLEKPINDFYKPQQESKYNHVRCKICIDNSIKDKQKQYRFNNKDKMQKYYIKRKYGISFEQKNQMIIDQNGQCASCGDILGINPRNICLDHNHINGKIRKILCKKCNAALGFMEENVEKILKLAEYAQYCNNIK